LIASFFFTELMSLTFMSMKNHPWFRPAHFLENRARP